MNRRTLFRVFAAAVAIAAISPLFAASPGCRAERRDRSQSEQHSDQHPH